METAVGTLESVNREQLAGLKRPARVEACSTTLFGQCVGEVIGTFILVFFGVGSIAVAVYTGGIPSLWHVALAWGMGLTLAIYSTGACCGAHLNPAITVAFCLFRGFPAKKVAPYITAQFIGAFLAAVIVYALFFGAAAAYEAKHQLVRGQPGSEASGMVFVEYFPNPGIFGSSPEAEGIAPWWRGLLAEFMGTLGLAFAIFAITDNCNKMAPKAQLVAPMIGMSLAILIMMFGSLSQAGFNPARDFSPRLFAALAGWGRIALPGPRWGFWIYIVAPMLGAVAGAAVYTLCLNRQYRKLGEPATVEAD